MKKYISELWKHLSLWSWGVPCSQHVGCSPDWKLYQPCTLGAFMEVSSHEWVKSLSRVRLFATPWTVAHQAPQSMEFSKQEYWSGLPFPSPRDLPNPGIEPGSPTLQANALPSEPGEGNGKPLQHSCLEIPWTVWKDRGKKNHNPARMKTTSQKVNQNEKAEGDILDEGTR